MSCRGCKWFQLWREHIDNAVSLNQRLQVYYFGGMRGKGKIESWEACCADAMKREQFWSMKRDYLKALLPQEKARLDLLSSKLRDDSKGEEPGSKRGDEEERMFVETLLEDDRPELLRGAQGAGEQPEGGGGMAGEEGVYSPTMGSTCKTSSWSKRAGQ
jgi:hypothetical protein